MDRSFNSPIEIPTHLVAASQYNNWGHHRGAEKWLKGGQTSRGWHGPLIEEPEHSIDVIMNRWQPIAENVSPTLELGWDFQEVEEKKQLRMKCKFLPSSKKVCVGVCGVSAFN